jgi:hypothetical protein
LGYENRVARSDEVVDIRLKTSNFGRDAVRSWSSSKLTPDRGPHADA